MKGVGSGQEVAIDEHADVVVAHVRVVEGTPGAIMVVAGAEAERLAFFHGGGMKDFRGIYVEVGAGEDFGKRAVVVAEIGFGFHETQKLAERIAFGHAGTEGADFHLHFLFCFHRAGRIDIDEVFDGGGIADLPVQLSVGTGLHDVAAGGNPAAGFIGGRLAIGRQREGGQHGQK